MELQRAASVLPCGRVPISTAGWVLQQPQQLTADVPTGTGNSDPDHDFFTLQLTFDIPRPNRQSV